MISLTHNLWDQLKRKRKTLFLPIILIAIYYTVVLSFSVNFPISDDFALIEFINEFISTNGFYQKLMLFWNQHNEHRIVTTKIVFLAYYEIFGTLNFTHLCLIGNLAILAIYVLLWQQLYNDMNNKATPLLMIFITCMLFQYGSGESMIWAMASISNYYVLFFTLLSLAFLKENKGPHFILAVIFAVLSSCTQGNGLAALIAGALYLFSQKRYRLFMYWLLTTLVVFFFYFSNYTTPTHHSDPLYFYSQILKITLFTFAFIGSAFGMGASHYPVLTKIFLLLSILIGLYLSIITLYFIYRKKYKDGNIFIWFNIFIMITAFLTAVSRINFGLTQAMASRYHINSSLMVISTTIIIIESLEWKNTDFKVSHVPLRILVFSLLFYTAITFPIVFYISNKTYEPAKRGEIVSPIRSKAVEILKKADTTGVFKASKNQYE